MIKQPLHEGWTVRAISNLSAIPSNIRDAAIPARVPGCVHTDLLRAGLIDDPYFGQNEPKLFWIGLTDWQYTTYFNADPKLFDHERIDLACDGLDTVATIFLNGSRIASKQNMHCAYRFDVRPFLKKGGNELTIQFESPVNYAANMRDKLGYLPGIFYGGAYNFIRKMACNFGWDWGPVVATCGIWKGVRLEAWSIARLAEMRPKFNLRPDGASELDFSVRFEFAKQSTTRKKDSLRLRVSLTDPAGENRTMRWIVEEGVAERLLSVDVPNPTLWWPAGHGSPSQYSCQFEVAYLARGEPLLLDQWKGRLGLRTAELDTSLDDIGRQFVMKVNDKPIFCKGFNWIPDDCFLDRACDPARVRNRIQQALDANANMLRVWGGGIYETDEFYDICDEKGMLVWQDFLFACAAYPEDEPFKTEVEAEARYNVARLSHHPSLVLWNGCNENLWMYRDLTTDDGTGKQVKWLDQLADKKWGVGYYLDLLPKIVKELDPSRPYWAASPWSGDPDVTNGIHPNLASHGNKHIWEVWHGPGDYNNYRQFAPRFCSEFGYQGPANYSTIAKFFEPVEMTRNSATMELHQKSPGGNARNERLLAKDFDVPENFDDWHYLLQLNQARALQTGVEWFRSRQPVCMGTLYWQLNDCYPVTSWSAIDSEGGLKPLWYATRRFFAPRLLTIQPENDALVLYVNNDSDEAWEGDVLIRRMDFNSKELGKLALPIKVAPRTNSRPSILPAGIAAPADKTRELIVAEFEGFKATWFFAPDRDLAYPQPKFTASLDQSRLTVRAETLLRDVVINVDRLDPAATISDNLITLLPGDTHRFEINSSRAMTLDLLTNPPVFQCANRFGRKS